MTELMDKLERARFLAVVRLRRIDESAADLLDRALILVAECDGVITLHVPESANSTEREYEVDSEFADSETEHQLAAFFLSLWPK